MEKAKKFGLFVFGLLLMTGLAIASTTISDSGSSYDADIELDNADLVLTGSGSDFISDSSMDFLPNGQTTRTLRLEDTGSNLQMSVLGGDQINFNDDLFFSTGKDIKSQSYLNLYPYNQESYGFRFTDYVGVPAIEALGSTELVFQDRLTLTQGFDVGVDKSIKLYADTSDVIGEPQAIELYSTEPESKAYLAWKTWYDSTDDGSADTYAWTAWLGAHYNTSINGDAHQHWSVETLDTDTGYINTRFGIDLGKPVDDMSVYVNAVNHFDLHTGVDLRFTENGVERALLELNTSTKNLELTMPTDKHVVISTPGNGEVRVDGTLAIENGENIIADTKLDFYVSDQYTRSITFEDDGSNAVIKSYGGSSIKIDEEDLIVSGLNDGTGSVVCIKSNGALGTCTTAVDASGDCSCA